MLRMFRNRGLTYAFSFLEYCTRRDSDIWVDGGFTARFFNDGRLLGRRHFVYPELEGPL